MIRRSAPGGAFTLIEVLGAAGLAAVVVAACTVVLPGGQRLERAAQLSVAVQGALLARERIALDLWQMGMKPGVEGPVRIGSRSIAFYRTSFEGANARLTPIRYVVRPTPGGNLRLVRQEFGGNVIKSEQALPGTIVRSILFKEVVDPLGGGRHLLVQLTTLDEDVPASRTGFGRARTTTLAFVHKYRVPGLLGAGAISSGTDVIVDGDLPATP
ncbi:MAG: hypothetical protein HY815_04265 [Candidatus Riflebacteria bacterium]|nr:hypothetical protein [Candidatus Riflebacteria bacterium]